ncbi:hypothetical protein KP509_16G021500 [Ceratopteris richardii]|uniref:Uncharacterized protein n=1 Tax=Ceratopteris richardii TaxID=49495 RepID=A0A8T2SYN7_CERRI|nr:hypothetical protein KP509_16G021500 [Ceratopteris richardii]
MDAALTSYVMSDEHAYLGKQNKTWLIVVNLDKNVEQEPCPKGLTMHSTLQYFKASKKLYIVSITEGSTSDRFSVSNDVINYAKSLSFELILPKFNPQLSLDFF